MNAFRKSLLLFTLAIVVAPTVISSASARIAPNHELGDRKNSPIVSFHGLEQNTYSRDVLGATKEAGTADKRYAAIETNYAAAGTRSEAKFAAAGTQDAGTTVARQYADAVDTLGQYTDASRS